MSVAQP